MSAERQTSNGVKNKAFIFDMDGVVINSEPLWEAIEREYWPRMFGADVAAKMPSPIGIGVAGVLKTASSLGAIFDREDALTRYEEIARNVYARAPVTPGIDVLLETLQKRGFKLGLVSQTREDLLHQIVRKLPSQHAFEIIISLHEHPELKPKPAPDGYVSALRTLAADPAISFVLEDSNYGIEAGKAAGCYVIGYRGNLVGGYDQHGADSYADTMQEVAEIVQKRTTQP